MMKLASINETGLTHIKASEVRARITLNSPAELQTRNVKLVLKFRFNGEGEQAYYFELILLSKKSFKEKTNWFSKSIIRNQFEFKLSDASISEFKKYQREFLKYGKPKKYHWTVYYYLKKQPPTDEKINLDLELKLSQLEDFFYLLKNASVDVNESK